MERKQKYALRYFPDEEVPSLVKKAKRKEKPRLTYSRGTDRNDDRIKQHEQQTGAFRVRPGNDIQRASSEVSVTDNNSIINSTPSAITGINDDVLLIPTATVVKEEKNNQNEDDIEARINDRIAAHMGKITNATVLPPTARLNRNMLLLLLTLVFVLVGIVVFTVERNQGRDKDKSTFLTPLPSDFLTISPTTLPSTLPSFIATIKPSFNPTAKSSFIPSTNPSFNPTANPSFNPTMQPSSFPTMQPSSFPAMKPSISPSETPSTTTQPSYVPCYVCEDENKKVNAKEDIEIIDQKFSCISLQAAGIYGVIPSNQCEFVTKEVITNCECIYHEENDDDDDDDIIYDFDPDNLYIDWNVTWVCNDCPPTALIGDAS